jgi:valyl-tRNA synthetase
MVSPWPLLSRGKRQQQEGAQAEAAGEPTLPRDEQAEQQFASFQALVRAIRNARSQYNVDVGRKIAVILKIEKPGLRKVILEEAAVSFSLLLLPFALT